jgi:DNA-binding CsgD family transcriptional regulator
MCTIIEPITYPPYLVGIPGAGRFDLSRPPNLKGVPFSCAANNNEQVNLLERQPFLAELSTRLAAARAGNGQIVYVCGEAGIGKSALVNEFLTTANAPVVLRGYCDALVTPQALGPVLEIAAQLPDSSTGTSLNTTSGKWHERSREQLFPDLCTALRQLAPGSIVLLEDLHWADEATLDFLRYLGKRIAHTSCLLLATYRDDEVGGNHPLRRALGDVASDRVARLKLQPLTESAVRELSATTGRNSKRVYQITNGNPFFVRELLSAPIGTVPETVRDSMTARLARCSPDARQVSELVALSPGRMEIELLTGILGSPQSAIDESIERGVLTHDRDALAFRHELARRAVEDTLSPGRARLLHAQILAAIEGTAVDVARRVHHASGAHDRAKLFEYAPLAGRRCASLGAHREAAAYFRAALDIAGDIGVRERLELLEAHAYECYLTDQISQAVETTLAALALWRELGDVQAQGRTLRFVSRLHWWLGDSANAEEYAAEAIALLEPLPVSRDLAMAYSNRSQLAMLANRTEESVDFGERAIAIARDLGDVETESHALNNVGASRLAIGDSAGRPALERALALALEHDLHEHAARAYVNLVTSAVRAQDIARAPEYFTAGLAYCEERDLDSWTTYLRVYQAWFDLDRGDWDQAAACSIQLVATATTAILRIPALVTLGQIRVRRGDPGADPILDEALSLALPTAELQRIGPVAAARAEAAFYRGDMASVVREADIGLALIGRVRDAWIEGKLLYWKSRVAPVIAAGAIAEPYRLLIAGDYAGAAVSFAAHLLPYEQALALAECGPDSLAQARAILQELGATAALRMLDVRFGAARAPRKSTATNPHGLTTREIEVLKLLGGGHTNAELAKRLFLSAKTVDHHVSSILSKLNVRSRAQAVTAAYELGILEKA